MSVGRIIGLGQPFAGDDAVGLAVVAHLRAQRLAGIELCEAIDATELIALVGDGARMVLVDAMIGTPVGQLRSIAIGELDDIRPFRASSHGFGVSHAIMLARVLSPGTAPPPCVHLVGIGIATAARGEPRLSPAVRRAVPAAAALAVALARDLTRRGE
jgi:hydrogenase maturation protease